MKININCNFKRWSKHLVPLYYVAVCVVMFIIDNSMALSDLIGFYWEDIADDCFEFTRELLEDYEILSDAGLLWLGFIALLTIVPGIFYLIFKTTKKNIEACNLEFNDNTLFGQKIAVGREKQINIPIFELHNAVVSKNVFDYIRFGQTVKIYYSSKCFSFHCVTNANEFVEMLNSKMLDAQTSKTEKIPEYKENDLEKLKQYKEMLDAGLISDEEFEIKKKQILQL